MMFKVLHKGDSFHLDNLSSFTILFNDYKLKGSITWQNEGVYLETDVFNKNHHNIYIDTEKINNRTIYNPDFINDIVNFYKTKIRSEKLNRILK